MKSATSAVYTVRKAYSTTLPWIMPGVSIIVRCILPKMPCDSIESRVMPSKSFTTFTRCGKVGSWQIRLNKDDLPQFILPTSATRNRWSASTRTTGYQPATLRRCYSVLAKSGIAGEMSLNCGVLFISARQSKCRPLRICLSRGSGLLYVYMDYLRLPTVLLILLLLVLLVLLLSLVVVSLFTLLYCVLRNTFYWNVDDIFTCVIDSAEKEKHILLFIALAFHLRKVAMCKFIAKFVKISRSGTWFWLNLSSFNNKNKSNMNRE